MTDLPAASWQSPGYSDIAAAARVGDELEVQFVSGDVVHVPPTRFGVEGQFEVRFDPNVSPAVLVVTPTGERELSWVQIRTATDPEFAQEMRRQDAEESRRIGRRLRALREDRGLSQRDVAGLVGMTAPQLSKIESGAFDLRISTVQTLLRAMGATFADISGPDAIEFSQRTLRRTAEKAGVTGDLIDRLLALAPRRSLPRLLVRGFGWDPTIPESSPLGVRDLGLNLLFKTAHAGADPASSPLVRLAVTCSEIALQVARLEPFDGLPSAAEARRDATGRSSGLSLGSLTEWAWERGVAVMPLHGRGAFCAAAWLLHESPVVVVKDSRSTAAFWMFDLAHELGHIALGHVHGAGIVDIDQIGPDETIVDAQERAANSYALELLLGDHRGLIEAVRRESRGNYLRFKGAVATIAKQANITAGLLGMVAAYELVDIGQPKDRWGSATNLAVSEGHGRDPIEHALRARLALDALSDDDALLMSATVLSG